MKELNQGRLIGVSATDYGVLARKPRVLAFEVEREAMTMRIGSVKACHSAPENFAVESDPNPLMNTSLLFRSLSLALALVVPAFGSPSDDIVTLDSIIAGTRTAPFRIKVGMDQKQVCDGLGAPDVVVGRNLWGYINVTLHGCPPGESYDALVIFMVDGRVRMLKQTRRTAVLDLVARVNQAKTGGQVADVTPRPVTPLKREGSGRVQAANNQQ